MPANPNQKFVAEELNKLGRDEYLTSLFVPTSVREDVQALLAFSVELRIVRQRVSEPTPGEIRLQWWNDALDGKGHGAVRDNPIADCLLDVIEKHALPTVPLKRMIAAHRFDLYDDAMPDTNQFEGYAGETRATLFQFMAMMLDKKSDPSSFAEVAGHLGVAACYIDQVERFGRSASNGQVFLPLNVFASFGVTDKEIFTGKPTEAVVEAVSAHLAAAQTHLDAAKTAAKLTSKVSRPAFASIALFDLKLKHLNKTLSDPYRIDSGASDWRKLLAMMSYSIRN